MLKLDFIGNLGRDAEVKTINEKEYVSFSVGVPVGYGDKKNTQWVSVLYRNAKVAPFMTKGTKVYVSGNPAFSVYNETTQVNVMANDVELLTSKKEREEMQSKEPEIKPAKAEDDDLPF